MVPFSSYETDSTYTAPTAKIALTPTFFDLDICSPQTSGCDKMKMIISVKTSRTCDVQYLGIGLTHIASSAATVGAAVKPAQFPEMGMHVKILARNIERPQRATRTMIAQLAILNVGPRNIRRLKKTIEHLVKARQGMDNKAVQNRHCHFQTNIVSVPEVIENMQQM